MLKEIISEDLLHFIWEFKLFEQKNLRTTTGEKVELINVGKKNSDAGPDFFNAKIIIGNSNTKWAGNVEVHINSSDWYKHKHNTDKAYDNVILHVVYNDDKVIKANNGEVIPTIEIKNLINKHVFEKYLKLINVEKRWIPCQNNIKEIDKFITNSWLERLLVERLEQKANKILELLKLNNNSWEDSFYQHIAKDFGLKINAEPFEQLAKSLPLNILAKHKSNILQIEALLFGQSGLLDRDFKDEYPIKLKKEYLFLKQKWNLKPLDKHLWKFLRLRPQNFPTIRIAQFAQLIYKSTALFSKIIEAKDVSTISKLMDISTSEYWQAHYVFDKTSPNKIKNFGTSAIHNIIINTIVPFTFVYGRQKQIDAFADKALSLLEELPSEKNAIISKWHEMKIDSRDAFHSQALIHLKNNYCIHKKCLSCTIGNKILQHNI